jgi:hypothetical protein
MLSTVRYTCSRGNDYIRNNRRIVGSVVFYTVRVVSKESRRLTDVSEWHNLLYKPPLTDVLSTSHINVIHCSKLAVCTVPTKYKCPHLGAVWDRVHLYWTTVLQMRRLFRKSSPSSRRRVDPISKHINGLGTNTNFVMGPDGARNLQQLCWREPPVIYWNWA